MKTSLVAAALLVSSLVGLARVHAAPNDGDDAASALVDQAAAAYDRNELDEALRLLARAYEIAPRPSILYNQAQVFRAKDDCAGALDAYTRFIATTTPADPNRERAQQRRAEMRTCVEKRGGDPGPIESPPAPAAPDAAPPAESETTTPPLALTLREQAPSATAPPIAVASQAPTAPNDAQVRGRRRAMRITGWTLVGAGVVAAGAAAVLAWQAHNIQEELQKDLDTQPTLKTDHVSLTDHQRALDEEGQRDATWARWLGAAAALAGGGGAALLIIYRPTAVAGTASSTTPSHATTALIGWSGTF